MNRLGNRLGWAALSLLGAGALAYVALRRGESINAVWVVAAAVCVYLIAYRFYSLYIATKVMGLDPARQTPAYKYNDGLDYVPTNKYVLFGHHFAAIAGAGPLVGPVLAAQMGYLPGMMWILAGVVFAGAVQDFIVLFMSMRRDGRSLGDLIKSEMGEIPGIIALFGTFMIMVIILAVLALIVVKALTGSPWGSFTVMATIPIALFMGIYSRYIRVGRIGEISFIGFILLMLAIIGGQWVHDSAVFGPMFTFTGIELTWMLIGYGFVASVIPVWLLLAPRDYLSTFLKIGTIVALAIGILLVAPHMQMPAVTRFVDGSGPVWSGNLFPYTHCKGGKLTTPSATPRAIARFLALAEKLLVRHRDLVRMLALHVREIGVVLGQADHQAHALPEVAAGLGEGGEHHCTCGVGAATKGDSRTVGLLLLRAFITVRMP
jgi:hypothetical protein